MAKDCMSKEEIDEFVTAQKEKIRELAEKNVQRQRFVDRFVQAVQQVRAQTAQEGNGQHLDFEKAIDDEMAKIEANSANSMIEVSQERLYIEVMEKLGERRGPVDEDVAIVETGASQGFNLKCPISGQFMKDAVRSKLCGHTYSKVGILAHIGHSRRYCECPIAGCTNKNVTQDQLEEDHDTQHAVRREIRRQGMVQEQQSRQADNLVDSDED